MLGEYCSLIVNHKAVKAKKGLRLMDFLREELLLTSVKDGCREGACGSCTILADGKPVRACLFPVEKFEGQEIITVEGLTEEEIKLYSYAYGKAGAVQCGFCIPGMVLCTKALLDQNKNPEETQIRQALKNNLCRCTGYLKIIKAVELAAAVLRGEERIEKAPLSAGIGKSLIRIDAKDKVTGKAIYTDDLKFEGMLYGSAVRSSYPRARVLAIHIEEAKKLQGVRAVLTAADIPGENVIGHLKQDWDTLITVGGVTRYLGDAICLIAAESKEILEAAKKLVKIDYEVLPAVFSPFEAMLNDAPKVHEQGNIMAHEKLSRGNAKKALEESEYVVTRHYTTPFTEHAFLETECSVALKKGEDFIIYSSDQGTYDTRRECSKMLGMSPEHVIVKNVFIGGGFGGKEDMTVQHHAALLAYHTGCPVKVKLSRKESILVHPKRHPMDITYTMGCDKNGNLTAMQAKIIADTGAYASLGGPVLQRACTHAAGPYHYSNAEIEGFAVYTNNPPAGAFRGFGVTQSCFACEMTLNLLAEKAGISPWQIRYQNAAAPFEELPNGQIAPASTALKDTLLAVKEDFFSTPYAGIACAFKNSGLGVGVPDTGRALLLVKNQKVMIHCGASCIGQGLGTVLTQVVCEATGLKAEDVIYEFAQTDNSPDCGTTSASRQTLFAGEAVKRACEKLLEAAGHLKGTDKEIPLIIRLKEMEGQQFTGEYTAVTDPLRSEKKHPVSHVAYGFATQVVLLKEDGTVKKIIAAHDVGRAVNPLAIEGQIEGGVIMSLGYALTEQFPIKDGKPLAKLGTLGLFRADKVPEVVCKIIEKNPDPLSFGAIGIGEITSIPTAPAAALAYYRKDHKFRTSLPLKDTPYRKEKR